MIVGPRPTILSNPFKPAVPLYEIPVIPLDRSRFFQPSVDLVLPDLIHVGVNFGSVFEFSRARLQPVLPEICSAPKHQPDPGFEFAVPHDGVLFQKPHRMGMPYFPFCVCHSGINQLIQPVANEAFLRRLFVMVGFDFFFHK